jgi:hypothetical protein
MVTNFRRRIQNILPRIGKIRGIGLAAFPGKSRFRHDPTWEKTMPTKNASADLRDFFRSELEDDPNATLGRARTRLSALRESGPDDEHLAQLEGWILETEELGHTHGVHCSLREFV